MKKFVKQEKDCQIGNAGDNRRRTKFKQKQEKRRKNRYGKEEVEKKSENNFINCNQQKIWEDKRTKQGHAL